MNLYMSDDEFESQVSKSLAHQKRIDRIVKEVFREGVHYGSATGQDNAKPSILKPGGEEAIRIFGLVAVPEIDEKIQQVGDEAHYFVTVRTELRFGSATGPLVEVGVGAANSLEKKWRYRAGYGACPACGSDSIIKGKEEYGGGFLCFAKRGGCGAKFDDLEKVASTNPDPLDLHNNILKYAKKRSYVDAALGIGFSAYFTQDLDEKKKFSKGSKAAAPTVGADPFDLGGTTTTPAAPPAAPAVPAAAVQQPAEEARKAEPDPAPAAAPRSVSEEIVLAAKKIATFKGGDFQDYVTEASSFVNDKTKQKMSFAHPSQTASEKWHNSTLVRLNKTLYQLEQAAKGGDPSF